MNEPSFDEPMPSDGPLPFEIEIRTSTMSERSACEVLDEALARGSISPTDLDVLLQSIDPDDFSRQMDQLLEDLADVALDCQRSPKLRRPETAASLGSAGGRVSSRYLKDLQRFPKMNRETELRFARRMEFAQLRIDCARSGTERDTRRTEYDCVRAEFVERNLHLVVAHSYAYRTYDVTLDDLIQEGNAALMRAVEKFDWRHGVRFRTYVAYWIRQAIERYLATVKGAVRVPHHLQQKFRRLKREGKLPRARDQELTADQVAEAFEMGHEAALHFLESSRPSFSIDQEVTKEGNSYRDFLVEYWEPEDSDRDQGLRQRLDELLASLDERERQVLALRFGLDGSHTHTLEEIGRAMSLSRERSRQIQQKALGKLRDTAQDSRLSDYL